MPKLGLPALCALLVWPALVAAAAPAGAPFPPGLPAVDHPEKNYALVLDLHDAGLGQKAMPHTQVVGALSHSSYGIRYCALQAAGRLGLHDALPAVRKLQHASDKMDFAGLRECAVVVEARIEATSAGQAGTLEQLRTQMAAVLKATGLDAGGAEAALRAGEKADHHRFHLAHHAALQIADMALRAGDRGLRNPMRAAPFNVALDLGAAPRAEASGLARPQRDGKILNSLVTGTANQAAFYCLEQILIDEGPAVRPTITAWLKTMAAEPPGKRPGRAFQALLEVLEGVGADAEATAAVKKLTGYGDRWVQLFARQTSERLQKHERHLALIGY